MNVMHSSLATPMISNSESLIFKRPHQFAVSIRAPQPRIWVKKSRRMSSVVVWAERRLEEEMRFAALRLHTKDEVKEGERQPDGPPISKWDPNLKGFLKFLVDSKLLFDILQRVVDKATFPEYVELRKTGLERSKRLALDLEWFEQQGHAIPHPSSLGINYAQHLDELSEKDPQGFICHFYMIYFGHTAGGTTIGRKVEKKLPEGKELEFYKYDGELSEILQNTRDKLNRVGERWSRKEKDHCLEETENSMMLYRNILRLMTLS